MALVAGVAGNKRSDGTQLQAHDYFPDLTPSNSAPVSLDIARAQRVARGLDNPADGANVVAGWERWALMCRQVSSRRSRGA